MRWKTRTSVGTSLSVGDLRSGKASQSGATTHFCMNPEAQAALGELKSIGGRLNTDPTILERAADLVMAYLRAEPESTLRGISSLQVRSTCPPSCGR